MLLAGPLTEKDHRTSSSEENVFDCSHPIPAASKQYFKYLQTKGVTHFKVPLSWAKLLPTGLTSKPQQAVARCYKTLLKNLQEQGLQPLVILHGSTVPDSLRSRYGGWKSQQLLDKFQQYAEFALREFGQLANSWVTFSDLDEILREGPAVDGPTPLQNILQLNKKIHEFYHQNFPYEGRRLSFGLNAKHVDQLSNLKAFTNVDFLSVNLEYNCASSKSFAQELRNLQTSTGNLPILLYKMPVRDCIPSEHQLLGDLLQVLWTNSLNIMGCDMKNVLDELDMQDSPVSYNKVDIDVYLLRGLGVNTYQFSISWARIFPSGYKDSLNEEGALYYDNLINALIESGIQPVATIYHWDLPQALQDKGGWTNPSIVAAYKDYAAFCFHRYGNRVKSWNTFSSPWVVSHAGHGTGHS
ncbi:lactase-phlorizin hydrolase-like [Poecilia latipinna]|uniref:lactase-phlorizin hydrolase-like n=1 Tax=Poecilia latipinna TaxID=48699 RepID=UPI00072ECB38|nr:PREDICTED: lactase-phlorizin hydrolase-like [Poecilia latipinna]